VIIFVAAVAFGRSCGLSYNPDSFILDYIGQLCVSLSRGGRQDTFAMFVSSGSHGSFWVITAVMV
jgi:hypothetical protein